MATTPIYFALGFSAPGCLVNSSTPHCVTTRRELVEAIKGEFYDDPRGVRLAMADLQVRKLWGHAKRHGLSSIFRELDCGKAGEVLCFMGMTEAEYDEAIATYDY